LLDTLSESALQRQQLFSVPYVKRLIDDHLNQRSDNRKELWTLLIFQLWSQKYLES
jgi:asparagine synthase (glutamine-hydrolysing)